MTQPTILDLYQDEEYLSIPGVSKGLLKSATADNPDYRIVDRGNGTEGVFYRSKGGMQYLLGDRPRIVPAATTPETDQPGFGEVPFSRFVRGVGETGATIAKGAVQGFAGLPGEVESIATGLLNNLDRAAVTRIQTSPSPFIRAVYELAQSGISFDKFIAGMSQDTVLPTTKEVGEFIDRTGIMPEREVLSEDAVAPAELIGEVMAPLTGAQQVKRVAGVVSKGAEKIKKAVTKRKANNKIPPTQQEPM
jgi:hypothetical protein